MRANSAPSRSHLLARIAVFCLPLVILSTLEIPCTAAPTHSSAPVSRDASSASESKSASPTEASATTLSKPLPENVCRGLSLNAPSDVSGELKALYEAISDFEKAFEKNDTSKFRTLVHPALSRERDKPDVFTGTVHDFGLEKAKLVRNAVYELHFPRDRALKTVACKGGELRGVVGPERQYAVMHSFAGGNEHIRVFTIYSPVQEGLKTRQGATKRDLGLVMLSAQVWTHGKQSPEVLLSESRKWSLLNEPIAAWALAEASVRIMAANPYFVPEHLPEAERIATASKARLPNLNPFREKVARSGTGWHFESLAVIFQQDGVEIGAKFRMKGEEAVDAQIEKCKTLGIMFGREFPSLTKRFNGYECMPYGEKEDLDAPPAAGTQFHAWRNLAQQQKEKKN